MQQQKKPFSLMAFIKPHRAGFLASVILAVLSVASGMVPYFAVAKMVNLLNAAEKNFSIYLTWGAVALIAYLLKSVLHGISTRCSHEATFHVLSELRRAVADKLTRVSMGYLTDTPSGRLKTTMVERVEQMEVPLAHIIPEMTSNLLVPIAIVVYLFVLDWRMALVSLITIPIGMLCYMAQMKEYPKKYGAVVQAGKHMSATTVEYIGGIEVIKAFNQGKNSYAKFTDRVKANASYFYHWMKSCQMPVSLARAISPTTMITILPVGWLLYASGSLPAGSKCKKGGCEKFRKETDIWDVWFDSGSSHAAVLMEHPGLQWPADLYLEGADQYRGWFQSSLLTSVAWKGVAPYKAVCTHGWVVDAQGKTMHKSVGNGIAPEEVTDKFGADILRLWVASSDYHSDIRISNDILKQLSEVYRKIRNTARYILGNLYDFNPDTDSVADDQLHELDRWALARMDEVAKECNEGYEEFDFHQVYHAIHNFCTIDLSNFYLDIIKDRLYVEKPDSVSRRAAQTAIYRILRDMTLVFAPILAFTCEEIWANLPKSKDHNPEACVFNEMPKGSKGDETAEFMAKWERIRNIRDDVNKALENARNQKVIGKSLEAMLTLKADGELYDFLKANEAVLEPVFIVSQVVLEKGEVAAATGEVEGLQVTVSKAHGEKCERCWAYSDTVGKDEKHPTLCARCAAIIG